MLLDADRCYRALASRDPRFDGRFFVGVESTGIYCRPICSARTPGRNRVRFFRTRAEAEAEGFRPCLLCRPELAPGRSPLEAPSRLVHAAAGFIERGYLNDHSIDALASRLGVSARHLRRAMRAELGVTPVALAQSHRHALAKQLLRETDLSVTEVAHVSGFRSLSRFNASFRSRHGVPPSRIRRSPVMSSVAGRFTLTLEYRPPLDWPLLLGFVAPRSTPGVERVVGDVYERTVSIGAKRGVISVRPVAKRHALGVTLPVEFAPQAGEVVARLRAAFDLDADPAAVRRCLEHDPLLGPCVARHPGLRVPGAFEPLEVALRAIVGQQVSVSTATTLMGRLVARFGEPFPGEHQSEGGDVEPSKGIAAGPLDRLFPMAARLAKTSIERLREIGLTRGRAAALVALCRAHVQGRIPMIPGDPRLREVLLALPGVGPWTAEIFAMRGVGDPDAFPAGDLAVRRVLGGRGGVSRAEAWRPFRAYAVMYLWSQTMGGGTL